MTLPATAIGTPRLVYWLIAAGFALANVGTNLISPLYGTYAARFGFSSGTITPVFAVYAFTVMPSMLVSGRVCDRWRRREPLVTGLLLFAVASVVLACARGTGWPYAGRILQGVVMGATSGVAGVALVELEPHGRRHRAAVVSTVAFAGGAGVGPIVGGLLAQYAPFVLLAASCVAQLAGTRLSARLGVVAGLAALVTGLGGVAAAFPYRSLALLAAGSVIAGAGHGLAFSGAVRDLHDAAPPGRRAGLVSALYVAVYLGVGGPVIGVGVLAAHSSLFASVTTIAAGITAVAIPATAMTLAASPARPSLMVVRSRSRR